MASEQDRGRDRASDGEREGERVAERTAQRVGDPPSGEAHHRIPTVGAVLPPFLEVERRSARREDERRGRRLRDRLEGEGGVTPSPALGRSELRNPLLLCDDDIRQTARALEGLEAFVLAAARLLEKPDLCRADVVKLLTQDVDAQVDVLSDGLGSLVRSLQAIASRL